MFSLEDITKIYLDQVTILSLKISELERDLKLEKWSNGYKQKQIDSLEANSSLINSNV